MNTIQTMSGKLGKVDWETVIPMVGLLLIILFSLFRAKGIEGMQNNNKIEFSGQFNGCDDEKLQKQMKKEIDIINRYRQYDKHNEQSKCFFKKWLEISNYILKHATYEYLIDYSSKTGDYGRSGSYPDTNAIKELEHWKKVRELCILNINNLEHPSNMRTDTV